MQLISFKEDQVKEVLNLIGIETDYEIIGSCKTCKDNVKLSNIGFIAKGKKNPELYCDNPACFCTKIAKEYKNEENKK